ncbi:MAG: xanthine dehydrogenase family protein molybdopterin-binding subunit [Acidobacteriales bacterium]|nr:xanthine dehydrogenase family protein molybdopterin-binding subunit [Terriglobales bacterium]
MRATRRQFLQATAGAGTGLVLAFHLPDLLSSDKPFVFDANAYIRIASDNTITLFATRSEMGQGVRTNLPAALAEELEINLSQVKVEQAVPGPRFKGIRMRTSGSGSSSGSFTALRRAGASAREMLIAAAAKRWSVDAASCRAENGAVFHAASGRLATYGELAEDASRMPVPGEPKLKEPKDFRLLGKPLLRLDGPAIVQGKATYGLDARVPGMMYAVMARSPFLGGKVKHFDGSKALTMSGVRHVVPIKSGIATGVAVVADSTWQAMRARDAVEIEWEPGPNKDFDSEQYIRKLQAAHANGRAYPLRSAGDVKQALAKAAKTLEAEYEYPHQVHAPLEPMNCTADVRGGSCEIWVSTQTPETAASEVATMLGLPAEKVLVHTTLLGGGFGRRLQSDFVHEAAELSKAIGKPVQLVWTRTDDTRHGYFQPASIERVRGGLDANGKVVAWWHRSADGGLTVLGQPSAEEKNDPKYYANDEAPWGNFDNFYQFPNHLGEYIPVENPVPTGPWRAVMYPATVFARESFLDELAHAAGRDPLELRLELVRANKPIDIGSYHIDLNRMVRVLEVVREKAAWDKPLPAEKGRTWGRGIALNIYHGSSYIAEVAEVSVARDLSDLRVHRIVCVIDCGFAINPAGIEGQVESGITWGLSATLHGKIDFRNGGAVQRNYQDCRVMRMDEMPVVETHILPSSERPAGFGEHPVPHVAPAVANAVFAATGKRIRRLPITPEEMRRS